MRTREIPAANPNHVGEGDVYDERYLDILTRKGRILGQHGRWFLYSYLSRKLREFSEGSTLLEVGFGSGYSLQRFEKRYRTIGLDISAIGIKSVRTFCKRTLFLQASAEKIPLRSNSCDIIIAMDIVEHLRSPEEFLRCAKAVLKKDGLVFVSTPNADSVGAKLKGPNWAGSRAPGHVGVRHAPEWRAMVKSNGFAIEREGSDFLWDIPYPIPVPVLLQKAVLIPPRLVIGALFGFMPWKFGENYYFILRKGTRDAQ